MQLHPNPLSLLQARVDCCFSCKTRLCPSCEEKRMPLFAEMVTEETLLPVSHRFWTFSIPKAIRGIMLRHRRFLKLLPRCAFFAVKQAMKKLRFRYKLGNGTPAPSSPSIPRATFFRGIPTSMESPRKGFSIAREGFTPCQSSMQSA